MAFGTATGVWRTSICFLPEHIIKSALSKHVFLVNQLGYRNRGLHQ
jgi:hypothetical protein